MAMDYLTSITSIFGADAVITGTGDDAVLSFKPAQTGEADNFQSPELAKPEAILLALLQKANKAQGITSARAMEISKSAILSMKDNSQVVGEQYSLRIFSGNPVHGISPDLI
jgi:2-keto-3-deoxy-L-rhamnonate aldolase RhmA